MTPDECTKRARVAALRRHHPHEVETDRLAGEFKADRLAEHIKRIVDAAPPLSAEQRDRLALLLHETRVTA